MEASGIAQAKRWEIYQEMATPYKELLDVLGVAHTDYTTQACLIILGTAIITTYLSSVHWLSSTLLAQDPPQARSPRPNTTRTTSTSSQTRKSESPAPQLPKPHSLPLRTLVYLASAIFLALPALYLRRHPPSFITTPHNLLRIEFRPLLSYLAFTLTTYLVATFLFATLILYSIERVLFAILTQLERQRHRRIRLTGNDSWLDAIDGSIIKAVKVGHGLAGKMYRELVSVEMWALPFRGWVWEPVLKLKKWGDEERKQR